MNKKTAIFIILLPALLGLFAFGNTASAQFYPEAPKVTTSAATNVSGNSATLNGYVSSNNNPSVSVWFEWGTTSYYGNQTNKVNYGPYINTSFSYYISGLTQNTSYYFRAVLQRNTGEIFYGNQTVFTTIGNYNCAPYNCYVNQPTATTYPATGIGNNFAVLNGFVDPNSYYATRWFEWGTNGSTLYNSTNKTSGYAGNFSEPLYNLAPNTTYYFRAVAQSGSGAIAYGNTLIFITSGNPYNTYANNTYIENTATPSKPIVIYRNKTVAPAVANAKDTTQNGETLIQQGAVAFLTGGGFLPNTLLGWLLIILLITLLVLAVQKTYYVSVMAKVPENPKKK